MANELVLEVEGLEELQKALAQFPAESAKHTRTAMGQGLAVLASSVKEDALHDMGITAASVGSQIVGGMGSEIIGKVGSNLPQAPNVLEWGRKASDRMPPPDIIEEWAARHGMEGAGWAIAKKIQARGWKTKPPKTMSNTLRNKAGEVVRLFEQGIEKVLRSLKL